MHSIVASASKPHMAYAGEIVEGDTLYLLGQRVYSTCLRRFLNADPASPFDDGGLNRYAYCAGDPVNRCDPSGHAWIDWLGAGLGLLASVAATVLSGGALAGAAGMAVPSLIALGAAAALDTVSVVASAGSIAAFALNEAALADVMGWAQDMAGILSGGLSFIAKAAPRALRGVASSTTRARVAAGGRGSTDVPRSTSMARDIRRPRGADLPHPWQVVENAAKHPGAVHYAADTAISFETAREGLRTFARDVPPGVPIYWYTAEGMSSGRNWKGASRAKTSWLHDIYDWMATRDLKRDAYGKKVKVIWLRRASPEAAEAMWQRPGVHVHAYCYAAFDERLLRMFRLESTLNSLV